MSTRCTRCNGVMLANMESKHEGTDDYYTEACMLCGHDNQPTLTLAELREREKPRLLTDAEKKAMSEKSGRKRKKPRTDRIAKIDRDGIYTRFLGTIAQWDGPVTARDIARSLQTKPGCVRACLNRAELQGVIRKGDTQYLLKDELGNTHGRVWLWERAGSDNEQIAS